MVVMGKPMTTAMVRDTTRKKILNIQYSSGSWPPIGSKNLEDVNCRPVVCQETIVVSGAFL